MSIANEPAFPATCTQYDSDHEPYVTSVSGMTLRQYYAGLAMQGLLSGPHSYDFEGCAIDSVRYADALLAELSKE